MPKTIHSRTQTPETPQKGGTKGGTKEKGGWNQGLAAKDWTFKPGCVKWQTSEYLGRNWTMFLRKGEGRDGSQWCVRIKWRGQELKRCTGQTDPKLAQQRAFEIIDAVITKDQKALAELSMRQTPEPKPEPVKAIATIGQVIRAYDSKEIRGQDNVKEQNVQALRNVIRRALRMPLPERTSTRAERITLNAEIDAMSSAILTEDLAQDYRLAINRAVAESADDVLGHRAEITLASLMFQGRSLFGSTAVYVYRKQHGLILPDTLPAFMAATTALKPKGSMRADYNPPSKSIIRKTVAAWGKLADRDLFIKLGLELACGLRDDEVKQITWGMFGTANGTALLDTRLVRTVKVKNKSGKIVVVPLDPFWSAFVNRCKREGWIGKAAEPVLDACTDIPEKRDAKGKLLVRGVSATQRLGNLTRLASGFIRSHRWDTIKTNHALRAYAGSMVAMKWEIYRASAWLRHASIKVTSAHYGHFITEQNVRPELVRIAWGKAGL